MNATMSFPFVPVLLDGQLTSVEAIKKYAFAGNATFTLRSKATGTRFTFKMKKSDEKPGKAPVWFVSLLRGQSNTDDFCYMGIAANFDQFGKTEKPVFRFTAKSSVKPEAPSAKAFVWFFNTVFQQGRLSDQLEIWHDGTCGRCGRKLTVPESVALGLGPECAGRAASNV